MASRTTPVVLIATQSCGACSHCGYTVDVDKYGYAAGHTSYNPSLRCQETCEGTQELTSVPRENPARRGL